MNYRHIYHAGNFADVFKHWILVQLLEKLAEKPKPFCVIDTHAGIGMYDLKHQFAQKTQEYNSGIKRILHKELSVELSSYKKIIAAAETEYGCYPGSPKIIQSMLRTDDRLFAVELHPEDFVTLQENLQHDRRVKVLQQNGYAAIKALLPPQEKRGLILIDPAFEQEDEFKSICLALEEGIKRFATGIYAVWYPIKNNHQVQKFYNRVSKLEINNALCVEIHANEPVLNGLKACGMLLINPPWQFAAKLAISMPKLLEYLEFSRGSYEMQWLKSAD